MPNQAWINRLLTTLAVLVVAYGLAAAVPAVEPGRDVAAATTAAACLDPGEAELLRLINRYRKKKGLKPLRLSATLTEAAEVHTANMAVVLKGDPPDDHDLIVNGKVVSADQNIKNAGYNLGWGWGENLSFGSNRATAAQVFAGWKASPAHNAWMLKRWTRAIGISGDFVLKPRDDSSGIDNYWYWTATFGGKLDQPLAC